MSDVLDCLNLQEILRAVLWMRNTEVTEHSRKDRLERLKK